MHSATLFCIPSVKNSKPIRDSFALHLMDEEMQGYKRSFTTAEPNFTGINCHHSLRINLLIVSDLLYDFIDSYSMQVIVIYVLSLSIDVRRFCIWCCANFSDRNHLLRKMKQVMNLNIDVLSCVCMLFQQSKNVLRCLFDINWIYFMCA